MLSDYFILGLDIDASDETIRDQYLKLVKQYPPEKNPQRFQDITESYERIKSRRHAIESRITGVHGVVDSESALRALGRSINITRRRISLSDLLNAAGLSGES
ncbi:MAG: J domain-containing protein [Desulfosalsimonadaceae bacterium]